MLSMLLYSRSLFMIHTYCSRPRLVHQRDEKTLGDTFRKPVRHFLAAYLTSAMKLCVMPFEGPREQLLKTLTCQAPARLGRAWDITHESENHETQE